MIMEDNEKIYLDSKVYLELIYKGKVRDVYAVEGLPDSEEDLLVMRATNRFSAFDVCFREEIEGKGAILNSITNFWFEKTRHIIQNHTIDLNIEILKAENLEKKIGTGVSVVKRLKPLSVEAVIRGFLAGSGWKEYQETECISGVKLESGLRKGEKFDVPIYTPSTKATVGHDSNISYHDTEEILGRHIAHVVRNKSLELYEFGYKYAFARGIIIADTKFEFGLDKKSEVCLMDEVMTPDSSRFWPAESYQLGIEPDSMDKQLIRDWLEEIGWDKHPPAPTLPIDLKDRLLQRYQRIYHILSMK